jgi:N-acetylmuramoyl-L-alanine amidase
MAKIFLDAGHGGKDPGAVAYQAKESEFNLKIVKALQLILKKNYEGVETKLSRQDDQFISLSERTDMANAWRADVFVAIHINAAENTGAAGYSTWIVPDAPARTRALSNVVHTEVLKATEGKFKDWGQRTDNFHVIKYSDMPAILTENGFITNSGDLRLLRDDTFILKIAMGHAVGIAKFLGLKERKSAVPDYTNHWAEAAIKNVMDKKLMNGYTDGNFKPDQPVTRAELATILDRLLKQQNGG